MSELRRKAAQVVVIATAESKQNVHLELLQSKGEHAFENILEIAPPSLVRGDTRFFKKLIGSHFFFVSV